MSEVAEKRVSKKMKLEQKDDDDDEVSSEDAEDEDDDEVGVVDAKKNSDGESYFELSKTRRCKFVRLN
jgi:hypothetical protein